MWGLFVREYTREFYTDRHRKTAYAATTILSLLAERIPPIHSAIDVGCGVGTWLSVLKERDVTEIQGIDGGWVDTRLLQIPRECFKQADLTSQLRLPRRYDLAISLEVAEHLPPADARGFVRSLTDLSDFVLFSAAIPYQGGRNHINEQWQSYWGDMFAAHDYVLGDFIRPRIWNDERIPFWYRQNTLFFYSQRRHADVAEPDGSREAPSLPLDLVHPEWYLAKIAETASVKGSWRAFRRALKRGVRSGRGAGR